MKKEFDYYLIVYANNEGQQICKPFYDDENGVLNIVCIFNIYRYI